MGSLLQYILKTPIVTESLKSDQPTAIEMFAQQIDSRARQRFGRSLQIRQVDAGSCNGCELEIGALNNPYYDIERFGMHFVASPRHADCLLVTGPVTRNMADPLKRTYEAMPGPKIVVAIGDCAYDCGVFAHGYGVVGPVSTILPVDAVVHGCPPEPRAILLSILAALDKTP